MGKFYSKLYESIEVFEKNIQLMKNDVAAQNKDLILKTSTENVKRI